MNWRMNLGLALLATMGCHANGQCQPQWLPGPSGQFASYGANGLVVSAARTWYPPGSSTPRLVIGGDFTTLAGGSFNHIASWDGTIWTTMTTGLNASVRDMTSFNGELVVGGSFTTAGGTPAVFVARWTGAAWIGMGTLGVLGANSGVSSLAVVNGTLYAAGYFIAEGAVSNVARWDGSAWRRLPLPGNLNNGAGPLESYGGQLVAEGFFDGVHSGVGAWNGSSWVPIGTVSSGLIQALKYRPADNSLYIGGNINTVNGVSTGVLARWDGAAWHAAGSGLSGAVWTLENYNDQLAVGGVFTDPQGSTNVALFDGSNFSGLSSGMSGGYGAVAALGVFNDSLIVGGGFASAGGVSVTNIAQWSGATWSALTPGPTAAVRALLPSGSGFYAGGDFDFFTNSTDGTAHRIFSTDGATPNIVTNIAGGGGPPNGTNGSIHAMANYAAGSIILPHNYLIVGGSFSAAGGLNASNMAQFDLNGWAPMGSGTDGQVNAVQQYRVSSTNNHVVATGQFSTAGGQPCANIAQWNGAWTPMGSGLAGVGGSALALFNGQLYVGGTFTSAGGVPASDLAHWNGTSWAAEVPTPLVGGIYALTVYNNAVLVAAGDFQSTAGPTVRFVAAWNGSSWIPMHAGLPLPGSGFTPLALAVHEGNLFLGGEYSIVDGPGDGLFNSSVFRWTGATWTPVSAGDLSGGVYALASAAGNLWAGGAFTVASGNATPHLAKLQCACYANCDFSFVPPSLNVNDFACYLNRFAAGDPYANCDGSATPPVINVLDFACFLNKFAAGCP